jgi:hypothetical protein
MEIKNITEKEKIKFWLNRGCIHYLINWNAGLDCFGRKVDKKTVA